MKLYVIALCAALFVTACDDVEKKSAQAIENENVDPVVEQTSEEAPTFELAPVSDALVQQPVAIESAQADCSAWDAQGMAAYEQKNYISSYDALLKASRNCLYSALREYHRGMSLYLSTDPVKGLMLLDATKKKAERDGDHSIDHLTQ